MVKFRLGQFGTICWCALLLAGPVAAQTKELERIAEVIEKIKLDYIDPVDDGKLVAGCREGLKRSVSEYPNLVTPSAVTSTITKTALIEISDTLTNIKQQTPEVAKDRKLVNACLSGMLKGLDRQSAFLDEEEFEELQVGGVPLGGIGLELGIDADLPKIVVPLEGGPAERAGLKGRDVIVNIDSVPTRGVPLEEIVKRLRGLVGSTITLTVEREGAREPLEFSLTRQLIQIQSVKWKSVAPGYAYIRISQFQLTNVALLAQAIESSYRENQGDLKGLILDLRNNPGGVLNACVGVSAAFLPKRALVTNINGRTEHSRMRLTAIPEDYFRGRLSAEPLKNLPPSIKTVPMVVLVNHASAACPEIVAAALQDHKRAKILGVRTFGQGTVSTILPMKDRTALKLTTARFYRPSGETIGEVGVTPDTILEEDKLTSASFGTTADLQLIQAVKQLGGQPALSQ